jgi:hypothetical protein
MMTSAGNFTWTRYDTLLRLDFVSFTQRCFPELCPRTAVAMNWHIELLAAKLAAARTGKIGRLIINLPPGEPNSLKSLSLGGHGWKIGWKILFSRRSGPP